MKRTYATSQGRDLKFEISEGGGGEEVRKVRKV